MAEAASSFSPTADAPSSVSSPTADAFAPSGGHPNHTSANGFENQISGVDAHSTEKRTEDENDGSWKQMPGGERIRGIGVLREQDEDEEVALRGDVKDDEKIYQVIT